MNNFSPHLRNIVTGFGGSGSRLTMVRLGPVNVTMTMAVTMAVAVAVYGGMLQ